RTSPLALHDALPILHERCFWEHLSPKQLIIPHDFRSTQWDRAPYLGYEFTLPLTETNRQRYKLPPEFRGSRPRAQEQHFDHGSPDRKSTRLNSSHVK